MIDIHTHLAYKYFFSDEFLEGIAQNTHEQLEAAVKETTPVHFIKKIVMNNLLDREGSKLISQMDSAGIEKSVLLAVDFFFKDEKHLLSIEEINKRHQEIVEKWGDRFILFCGIDPRRGKDGCDFLIKCITDYKARGLKLYPPCGFELDEKILFPYYEICEKYDIPVLTHIGPSVSSMRQTSNFPESVLRMSQQFKNVRFILGHAGILFFEQGLSLARQRSNVYVDVSGFQILRENKPFIENCMREFFNKAPEQILFGTDWPMFNLNGTQKKWVSYFTELKDVTSKQLDLFFSKNALEVLK